jgi:hypothetical protein
MIRRSTLIAVEVLLGLVAAFAIGIGVAWWRLSQGPIELNSIREHVETELSAARSGRPVGIESVQLAWSRSGGGIELKAIGVTIEDGRGGVLSRAEEARIELGVLPLLIGRISVVRAEFAGGEFTFTRRIDGAIHIAFGPEGSPPDIIIPPRPDNEPLDQRVARILDAMEQTFRPVGAGGSLREIAVRGAKLTVIDQAGGGRWTTDSANAELARRGRSLALLANARLEAAAGVAPATLRITTDTRFQSALVQFDTENTRPRALFSPAALGPFAGLDAPITAHISIGLDRETGVNRFEGEVVVGRGSAEVAGDQLNLSGGRLHGRYDIESDQLIIDEVALAGQETRISGDIRVRDVTRILRAEPNQPAAFSVSLPSARFEAPGTFGGPLQLSNVQIEGSIDAAENAVRFTRINARTRQAVLDGAGRIYWARVGPERQFMPGIELNGTVEGVVDAREVMNGWPIGLGEGIRHYLFDTIRGGRVTDGVVRIKVRPGDILDQRLENDAIDVRFNVSNGSMQFLETMSPVTNARASGVLHGNSFEMVVHEARFHGMPVTGGRIDAPQFKPDGQMVTIAGHVEGETRQLLEVLNMEPIALRERLPVDVATATGRGSVTLRLQRPTSEHVEPEDWRFTVEGTVRDFAGNLTSRNVALSQGQMTVRGNQDAVTVSGPIRAGTSAIQNVRWTENLNLAVENAPQNSEYQISGDFEAQDLIRLGYPIARYAQGRIGVTVTGEGRGFDVDNARIDLDLRNAAVQLPRDFWTKRAGVAATARFNVNRHSDGGLVFTNIDARGGGLTVQGTTRLSRDERLLAVDLTRLAIEDRVNSRLTATRAQDGVLDVNIRGELFDAEPFMNTEPAPAGPTVTPTAARPQEDGEPMRAHVVVDRLRMRGSAMLNDANVMVVTNATSLLTLSANGEAPGGEPFTLSLGPRAGDARSRVHFRSGDAGFAIQALTGADNVVGGTAEADGDWRGGDPNQARFRVRMRDFNVVSLPALAQLLSSAVSLTGLVDTLNGDGIRFNQLDAQMLYANDQLRFTEGRMAGPALGLTGSGSYDIPRDNLDVDGVLAPSPMLNLSMLGSIPVIGDLIVSRRGEGLFGMTYSINGHAEEPRVFVNPVSVLTPGILRRIFEPIQPRRPRAQQEAQTPPATQPPPRGTGGGAHLISPSDAMPMAPDANAPPPSVVAATSP